MTPADLKRQAAIDQARERTADTVRLLQEQAPEFLVALCGAMDTQDALRDLPDSTIVVLPIAAFRMMAQLAKVGMADIDAMLRRRKQDG